MDTTINPENLAEDRGLVMRQAFLLYPGESSEVDYKAGMPFVKGDNFALTLTKHILGMANAGGGYLVIGYPENAAKQPVAGTVSDEVLATYDLSLIASTVEKYTAGTGKVDIKVHKDLHPENGQTYPIIEVGGFKSSPFFCKSSAGGILEENALYIRIASARTIKIATPDEWNQLIDMCVAKRQDDTLRRFTDLMREMGMSPSTAPESVKKNPSEWIDEVRADAKKEVEAAGLKFEGIEIIHSIGDEKKWSAKQLLEAMQASSLKNTGWPIGVVLNTPEYKPHQHNKGLRSIIASPFRGSFDYWFISETGNFYLFRVFQEDAPRESDEEGKEREVWFDTNIWRIAEALEHAVALYNALGVDRTSKIDITLKYLGINDRKLTTSPGTGRHLFPTFSGKTAEYEWQKETSLDGLSVTLDQDVIEVSNGLFMVFDFQELQPVVIQGVIDEYRGNRSR